MPFGHSLSRLCFQQQFAIFVSLGFRLLHRIARPKRRTKKIKTANEIWWFINSFRVRYEVIACYFFVVVRFFLLSTFLKLFKLSSRRRSASSLEKCFMIRSSSSMRRLCLQNVILFLFLTFLSFCYNGILMRIEYWSFIKATPNLSALKLLHEQTQKMCFVRFREKQTEKSLFYCVEMSRNLCSRVLYGKIIHPHIA